MIFFMISFHIYKNAKNLSAKYYQENKERIKKAHERYQILCKEEKKNSNIMVVNVTKIFQNMKNKRLLSVEKNIIE